MLWEWLPFLLASSPVDANSRPPEIWALIGLQGMFPPFSGSPVLGFSEPEPQAMSYFFLLPPSAPFRTPKINRKGLLCSEWMETCDFASCCPFLLPPHTCHPLLGPPTPSSSLVVPGQTVASPWSLPLSSVPRIKTSIDHSARFWMPASLLKCSFPWAPILQPRSPLCPFLFTSKFLGAQPSLPPTSYILWNYWLNKLLFLRLICDENDSFVRNRSFKSCEDIS